MSDDPETQRTRLDQLPALARQAVEQARQRAQRAEARLGAAKAATALRQAESRSRMVKVHFLWDMSLKVVPLPQRLFRDPVGGGLPCDLKGLALCASL